jgi:hypothetical protein
MLVVLRLVNLYSLLVYVEHNGDESPKDCPVAFKVWALRQFVHKSE